MTISINWGTKIISIPKEDMTLIQSSPTEIWELNLNTLRLILKDLEDDEAGMPYPKTHNHNPPVTVSGVQLARVVEILEPYTITFQNGQYAVNLIGANSNIADRTNVNNVSVRSSNSAGLIQTREIEYASFNGGVTINEDYGNNGTSYPNGTLLSPVNNISDAIFIANLRGFNSLHAIGNVTFNDKANINNFIVNGEGITKSSFTIEPEANVNGTIFKNATINGTLDGNNILENCLIQEIEYVNGLITNCLLDNYTIKLGGSQTCRLLDCWSGTYGNSIPTIDMNGSGRELGVQGYYGGLKIINKSGSEHIRIDLGSGEVILDSTITNGTITIRGIGTLTNNSTGTIINDTGLISRETITNSTWNTPTSSHTTPGTIGEKINKKLLTTAKFIGLK